MQDTPARTELHPMLAALPECAVLLMHLAAAMLQLLYALCNAKGSTSHVYALLPSETGVAIPAHHQCRHDHVAICPIMYLLAPCVKFRFAMPCILCKYSAAEVNSCHDRLALRSVPLVGTCLERVITLHLPCVADRGRSHQGSHTDMAPMASELLPRLWGVCV